MKLLNPIIYVPHKVGDEWAKSVFTFDGLVDNRRVKREIIRAFQRGGEKVSPQYIDACIKSSLNPKQIGVRVGSEPLALPDENSLLHADETPPQVH